MFDARPMAELLNQIITIGGTTALVTPKTSQDLQSWMNAYPSQSIWHLAEDDAGMVLGFQWVEPHPDLPQHALNIATFVMPDQRGMGIGSRLFVATQAAARKLGYSWINATIRADNESGLIYYQSRSFEPYARLQNVRLSNGQIVDKVKMRFDL
jgi:L-amino acid N-acyltransferase YncA